MSCVLTELLSTYLSNYWEMYVIVFHCCFELTGLISQLLICPETVLLGTRANPLTQLPLGYCFLFQPLTTVFLYFLFCFLEMDLLRIPGWPGTPEPPALASFAAAFLCPQVRQHSAFQVSLWRVCSYSDKYSTFVELHLNAFECHSSKPSAVCWNIVPAPFSLFSSLGLHELMLCYTFSSHAPASLMVFPLFSFCLCLSCSRYPLWLMFQETNAHLEIWLLCFKSEEAISYGHKKFKLKYF
jgi:hypothetical protein